MDKEEWYVILNMNCKYEICRMCPKSGLFKGSYEECEKWIKQKKKEEKKDEIKNRISLALKDPVLQQGFEIICKENAELKDDNKVMADNYSKMEQKFYARLSKAKEIIKQLLDSCFGYNSKTVNYEVKAEAEQFLKEE